MNRRVIILKKNWRVLVAVPVLFLLVYIYPLLPWVTKNTLCAFKIITRVDCPGCGITRSFSSLLHGNFYASLYYHPLGILLAIGLIYLFIRNLTELLLGVEFKPLLGEKAKKILGYSLLVVIFGVWFLKLLFCGA